ncbi:MAG: acyl-CoA dehydrogenase family protein [Bdellovibrionales bacterium]|nr:acyl-CoA dehydrogenase family protein [Bdellovibrionales bacterium]
MISLSLNPETESLRKELRSWLKDNPPPQLAEKVSLEEFINVSRVWQGKLASGNWVGVHWPEEFGGRGLSIVEEAVVQEVLAEAGSPQLINIFGLTMVGPVLIKHGSSDQKKRFLPKILTAEEVWCQGFSEPEAGSDLASLKSTAVLNDSGDWIIEGQKVWTSFAQVAEWCFMLARTDSAAAKHKGLSYFLVPMKSEGITVRPLTQISGDKEFNEVFFDNVAVPPENMVGKPGDGWNIAISTLMYERVVLTFARHLQSESALQDIARLLEERSASEDLRARYGMLKAKSMALRALALSHLVQYKDGGHPGPEGSMDKLLWSEVFQEINEFGLELLGADSVYSDGECAWADGLFQHRYLYSRGRTIAAGTSEIQRGIIAQRVLGLPR